MRYPVAPRALGPVVGRAESLLLNIFVGVVFVNAIEKWPFSSGFTRPSRTSVGVGLFQSVVPVIPRCLEVLHDSGAASQKTRTGCALISLR